MSKKLKNTELNPTGFNKSNVIFFTYGGLLALTCKIMHVNFKYIWLALHTDSSP